MSGEDRWKVWERGEALLLLVDEQDLIRCLGTAWLSPSHKNRAGDYLRVCVYIFFLINVYILGLFGRIWSTACAFMRG